VSTSTSFHVKVEDISYFFIQAFWIFLKEVKKQIILNDSLHKKVDNAGDLRVDIGGNSFLNVGTIENIFTVG
jgi:hypothetical protein